MDDERAKSRVGKVLCGRYRLEGMLGAGGMAVVYAATHVRNRQRFAIKMLHPEMSLDGEVRARFLREGYVANGVRHRGAVKVIDDDVDDDGSAFLVMELLEGQTVEAAWERGNRRLDPRVVVSIADQLLDALAAAHDSGIVHRDVKPANVFITTEGVVKVLDFGIARLQEEGAAATQTGTTIGTPAFMAPEQAGGRVRDIDARTDIWSVGATMFALLSGQTVHQGETAREVAMRAAMHPARSLAAAVPDALPHLVTLVDRALAYEKTERWASAAEMRTALREYHHAVYGAEVSDETLRTAPAPAVGSGTLVHPEGASQPPPPWVDSRKGRDSRRPPLSEPPSGAQETQSASLSYVPSVHTLTDEPPRAARKGFARLALGGAAVLVLGAFGLTLLHARPAAPAPASVVVTATEQAAPTSVGAPIAVTSSASATAPSREEPGAIADPGESPKGAAAPFASANAGRAAPASSLRAHPTVHTTQRTNASGVSLPGAIAGPSAPAAAHEAERDPLTMPLK